MIKRASSSGSESDDDHERKKLTIRPLVFEKYAGVQWLMNGWGCQVQEGESVGRHRGFGSGFRWFGF